MIYTDGTHIITDQKDLTELHAFAQRIGLRRSWFQDHRHPHYDTLSLSTKAKALAAGAKLVTDRQLVEIKLKREGLQ
jgi:hypothetical protein